MKEDQLTPWFPAEVKPVHVGVYEVRRFYWDGGVMDDVRLRWNGNGWVYAHEHHGARSGDYASVWLCDTWRGLRSKP